MPFTVNSVSSWSTPSVSSCSASFFFIAASYCLLALQVGDSLQGVLRNEDAFSLQLLDRNGKLHLFDRQELRAIEYGKRSPMPRNIDKRLSEKNFQDLIAMLSRQARSKMRMEQQGENEVGR